MPNIANIVKAAASVIESLTDNKTTPLHVGEVMALWTYLAFVSEIIIHEEIGINTTTHEALRKFCENGLHVANAHKKQLTDFLVAEGVPLPPAAEDKPRSEPEAIPLGTKLTDNEIINTLLINFVAAGNICSAAASQSLRTDVGLMFLQFQTDKLALGFKGKKMAHEHGWLKIPPYYYSPGAPERT